MRVQDLKIGDRFINPTIPYHLNNKHIIDKVYWIARIYSNSFLIDNGVRLYELTGYREIRKA